MSDKPKPKATLRQIRAQYVKVRDAMNELYGPLAALEQECLTLDLMLGVTVDGAEYPEDPTKEIGEPGG